MGGIRGAYCAGCDRHIANCTCGESTRTTTAPEVPTHRLSEQGREQLAEVIAKQTGQAVPDNTDRANKSWACTWSRSELVNFIHERFGNPVAAREPAPVARDLPKLDDDDEVAFPNDSGLAVIHEARYWKLREYEERCEGAGVARDLDVAAEHREFEAAMRTKFGCSEHSFNRAYPQGYYNTVHSNTFGGRKQAEYAPVSMLWDVWRAARGSGDKANSVPPEIPAKQAEKPKPVPFCVMLHSDGTMTDLTQAMENDAQGAKKGQP